MDKGRNLTDEMNVTMSRLNLSLSLSLSLDNEMNELECKKKKLQPYKFTFNLQPCTINFQVSDSVDP